MEDVKERLRKMFEDAMRDTNNRRLVVNITMNQKIRTLAIGLANYQKISFSELIERALILYLNNELKKLNILEGDIKNENLH